MVPCPTRPAHLPARIIQEDDGEVPMRPEGEFSSNSQQFTAPASETNPATARENSPVKAPPDGGKEQRESDKSQLTVPTTARSADEAGESGVSPGRGEGGASVTGAAAAHSPRSGPSISCSTMSSPSEVDESREFYKAVAAIIFVIVAWATLFICIAASREGFEEPSCDALDALALAELRSCDVCSSSGLLLPLFDSYENSWAKAPRAVLYLVGTLCIFMGMGIICDNFMAAIEEITSAERIIWREVHDGAKRKFRVKVWNGTVANLTLMALGSSAPEILLSMTELIGNDFVAGRLGPSTIVGSAAFNLFVISAVCVGAIPAPEIRKIEGTDTFMVTASVSLFAYVWLLIILMVTSPDKVDIWEGVVTAVFFPVLVVMAFIADKGYLRDCGSKETNEASALEQDQKSAMAKYGKELPLSTLYLLRESENRKRKRELSKSVARKQSTAFFTGGRRSNERSMLKLLGKKLFGMKYGYHNQIQVGFDDEVYEVLECAGQLICTVHAPRRLYHTIQMKYSTRDGTAVAGVRYNHVEGYLSLSPNCPTREIQIPIIDDDAWQPDEIFYIDLDDLNVLDNHTNGIRSISTLTSRSRPERNPEYEFGTKTAAVRVLNDDSPGMIDFDTDEVRAQEGTTVSIGVRRSKGVAGDIYCNYHTIDDSAVAGKDFVETSGTLEFMHGEAAKTIQVALLSCEERPQERFKLVIDEASPGVLFNPNTDGGKTCATCDIVIVAKGSMSIQSQLLNTLFNVDRFEKALELWSDYARELLYCEGSPEDQAEAGIVSWACHIMALIWKMLFLFVPPPLIGGGWPCFFVALVCIGFVTALAGDIAALLGCCIGLPDDVTAITLVALGTSLPDTLASRFAAQHDETADNAIGNITGSNSVNVFLGIGISWTMGAVYWKSEGPSAQWRELAYDGKSFEELFLPEYPDGGFFVYSGTLGFSIFVYSCCAFICLAILFLRRIRYGGELGGPQVAQTRDAGLLFLLWCMFLTATIVQSMV